MLSPIESLGGRILVTGGSGFLGRFALEALGPNRDVARLTRRPTSESDAAGNLEDPESIRSVLQRTRPDHVLHLAGATPPNDASRFYATNLMGTLHLLDALRDERRPVRVVMAGSAAELGPVDPIDLPVGEEHLARPAEPYGLSKLLATTAGLAAGPPLEVMVARVFNPIGPGTPASQALGRFASLLAGADGLDVALTVGDLSPRRDFIDVRDVARALILLLAKGRPGRLYHVGTGRSRSVDEGLQHLVKLSEKRVRIEVDAKLAAGRGPVDSRADISRIQTEIGWEPLVSWERSMTDLWEEARLTARRAAV